MRRSAAAALVALSTALSVLTVSTSTSSAAGTSATRVTSAHDARPRGPAPCRARRVGPRPPAPTAPWRCSTCASRSLSLDRRRAPAGRRHPGPPHRPPGRQRRDLHGRREGEVLRPHLPPLGADHARRPAEHPLGHHDAPADEPGVALRGRQARLQRTAQRRTPRRRRPVRRVPQGAVRPGPLRAQRPRASSRASIPRLYSGYLVLDNDFARSQYGAKPIETARVTAAHEFFHAIQFGYDVTEDRWLMESTATWMEDQFADESNDNRQYLTVRSALPPEHPARHLHRADGFQQYGNWPFFEYLSEHYGRGIVRSIWNRCGLLPRRWSHLLRPRDPGRPAPPRRAHAGVRPLRRRQPRPRARLPGGRRVPGPRATSRSTPCPPARARPGWQSFTVHHLASQSVRAVPDAAWPATAGARDCRSTHRAPPPVPRRTSAWSRSTARRPARSSPEQHRCRAPDPAVQYRPGALRQPSRWPTPRSRYHRCFTDGTFSCSGFSDDPHPTFRLDVTAFRR